MTVELIRTDYQEKQTLGVLVIYNDKGRAIFEAPTLELDMDGNKEGESCIPEGVYELIPLKDRPSTTKYNKESQGYFPYLIKDVPNRTGILIHHGNFYDDILGCVLAGEDYYDIDGDGLKDVTNSRATLKKLNKVLDEPTQIRIMSGITVS